ncbi:MAG: hypothetical protein EOP06_03955 [Proteobacteria bacterium]|nr:MAG: hypothetical protein EOP06_03955 [Pseudomonadota bacterium]
MKENALDKLSVAVAGHSNKGRFSRGTAAIVNTLHAEFGISYIRLADIAAVSTAGIRRWRDRNIGDASSFKPLLQYAQNILDGKTSPGELLQESTSPKRQPASLEDGPSIDNPLVRGLTIAQAKQGLAHTFEVKPDQIEIIIKG